jgi:hypothetical protein
MTVRSRGIRIVGALVVLGLCALALLARTASRADAASASDCSGSNGLCVMVLEIDGLEPKDVTAQNTPVLFNLAHPKFPSGTGSQGVGGNGRGGYWWNAARGVMSAGTAPAAYSLLSGGYPEKTDIPADQFKSNTGSWVGLNPLGDGSAVDTPTELPDSSQIPDVLQQVDPNSIAVSGDPGLGPYVNTAGSKWYPGMKGDTGPSAHGDPHLCGPPSGTPSPSGPVCPADDLQTTDQAYAKLSTQIDKSSFAYIHLAELGRVKQQTGDTDNTDGDANPSVARALATTDAAVGRLIGQYATTQGTQEKWAKTVLFVVGNHGYESTPPSHRIMFQSPSNSSQPEDLSDWVKTEASGGAYNLAPEGTMALVYPVNNTPANERTGKNGRIGLAGQNGMRQKLLDLNKNSSACPTGKCISEVLYTQPDPETADPATRWKDTVQHDHPTWRMVGLNKDTNAPTGSTGDLVVVFDKGWAAGRIAPVPVTVSPDPNDVKPATNPWLASSGGPRNRAIAAFVNGPDGQIRDNSMATAQTNATPGSADAANAKPGDDPIQNLDDPKDKQLETVDVAVTSAFLLNISLTELSDGARPLQEAFVKAFIEPKQEEIEPIPPEEPPPPPPPPPPPLIEAPEVIAPSGFDYTGLVRDLKAVVVDKNKKTVAEAPAGADLSYVLLEGDFGKEQSQVTLTFYRQVGGTKGNAAAAAKAKKPKSAKKSRNLKTLVRFKPFSLGRGHIKISLKVPPQFAPDYVGVAVQQVEKVTKAGSDRLGGNGSSADKPDFQGVGRIGGGIVPIRNAELLHTRKKAGQGKSKAGTKKGKPKAGKGRGNGR